jgi:hypothetical protein
MFILRSIDFETHSSLHKSWLPSNIRKISGPKAFYPHRELIFALKDLNSFSTELHRKTAGGDSHENDGRFIIIMITEHNGTTIGKPVGENLLEFLFL